MEKDSRALVAAEELNKGNSSSSEAGCRKAVGHNLMWMLMLFLTPQVVVEHLGEGNHMVFPAGISQLLISGKKAAAARQELNMWYFLPQQQMTHDYLQPQCSCKKSLFAMKQSKFRPGSFSYQKGCMLSASHSGSYEEQPPASTRRSFVVVLLVVASIKPNNTDDCHLSQVAPQTASSQKYCFMMSLLHTCVCKLFIFFESVALHCTGEALHWSKLIMWNQIIVSALLFCFCVPISFIGCDLWLLQLEKTESS
jgi:hypothetical protein